MKDEEIESRLAALAGRARVRARGADVRHAAVMLPALEMSTSCVPIARVTRTQDGAPMVLMRVRVRVSAAGGGGDPGGGGGGRGGGGGGGRGGGRGSRQRWVLWVQDDVGKVLHYENLMLKHGGAAEDKHTFTFHVRVDTRQKARPAHQHRHPLRHRHPPFPRGAEPLSV